MEKKTAMKYTLNYLMRIQSELEKEIAYCRGIINSCQNKERHKIATISCENYEYVKKTILKPLIEDFYEKVGDLYE